MNTRRTKNHGPRLVLSRETLRALAPEELSRVAGGSITYLPEDPEPDRAGSNWSRRCPGAGTTHCTTVYTQ